MGQLTYQVTKLLGLKMSILIRMKEKKKPSSPVNKKNKKNIFSRQCRIALTICPNVLTVYLWLKINKAKIIGLTHYRNKRWIAINKIKLQHEMEMGKKEPN